MARFITSLLGGIVALGLAESFVMPGFGYFAFLLGAIYTLLFIDNKK